MWRKLKRVRKNWRRLGFPRQFQIILVLFIIVFNIFFYLDLHHPPKKAQVIITMDGKEITVRKGAVQGFLDNAIVRDSTQVHFRGWAFDARNSKPAEAILITYAKKNIYWGKPNLSRPGLANRFGDDAIESGFKFVLSLKQLKVKELNRGAVRVFAISNGVASELNYPKWFK